MPRGRGHSLVHYRSNRIPHDLDKGRKVISDYGDVCYEDDLAIDDYGNTFDSRRHFGDVDYGGGAGFSRPQGG